MLKLDSKEMFEEKFILVNSVPLINNTHRPAGWRWDALNPDGISVAVF